MAWSCKETNRLDIDVSQTEADISIERWDQELFELTPVSMRKHHPRWKQEYGNLYTRYIEDVLQMGSVDDSNLFAHLRAFTTDVTIAEVQAQTQEMYPSLDKLEEELEGGWKHFAYHFPDKEIPAHTSLITGFSAPLVLTERGVGISLEMYLGEDCLFYDYLQFPMYLRQRMNADHLAPSVLKAWLETEFAMEVESPTLLDVMIHEGKVLYCMDAMFPTGHDSVKIGYSAKQLEWAEQHTEQVWAHLIDQELLFSTDAAQIGKFTNDGPFTTDLVKESPARMGIYLGWQIVRAYMDRQPDIDLPKLMATNDHQHILNESKFKP